MNCFSGLTKELFVYHPFNPRGNCNNPINTTSNNYLVFAELKTSMCLSTKHIWCLSNASHILVVSDIRYNGMNRILRNCYPLKTDGTPWCWMVTSSTHLSSWGKSSVSTKNVCLTGNCV